MLDLLRGRGLVACKSRYALTYLFNIFTFVGTNPQERQSKKYYCLYYMYSITANFICCFFSPLSFHIGYIKYFKVLSTTELLSAIQNAVHVTAIPVKIIAVTWHMKSLLSARIILDELDANYRRAEDLLRIRQCIRSCCKIIVIFCVTYYTFEVTTIAFGVLQHRAPLAAWVPYLDAQRRQWEYWSIVAWDTFVMFILLAHQLGNDTYPTIYIFIIRTHMQLLVERAKRLGRNRMLNAEENYADILACIRTHCQIMELARIVAPVISITLFTQFATTAITVLNWFGDIEFPENIISFAFFSCQLMQVLPCCYFASHLIADCDQLPNAIFHTNWMDQNRRFRNTILFFIQRTQNPIRFSCLKLFGVNLATGVAIGKFAFSLYTFIHESEVDSKTDK